MLFTTQEDFTGWNAADLVIAPDNTDLDGSETGGLATGGATGTGGSLMAGDTNNASNYTFAYSSELSGNADLISALGTEGFLAIDYIPPTDGSYFQLGIVLNYDNIFGQFFGGGAINNGDGTFTTLIPYEFFPDEIATYFQLGIIHNSDANEAYIVDNIRVVNLPEDADSLFTTQEDFAGFTSNDLLLSIDATDLDGSTIGGLATGGAAGTGGFDSCRRLKLSLYLRVLGVICCQTRISFLPWVRKEQSRLITPNLPMVAIFSWASS